MNITRIIIVAITVMVFSCKKEKIDPFKTDPSGSFTDSRDGAIYKWVKIGNQIWMAENLRATKYNNGDDIGTTNPPNLDIWNETSPKYQWANGGDESNVPIYGCLYTWFAITDNRGICPTGWHLPSDNEWKTLEMSIGMSQSDADNSGYRGTNEGSKLAGNAELWFDGILDSDPALGSSPFMGLPGGGRLANGNLYLTTVSANWWSSTESNNTSGWSRQLFSDHGSINRAEFNKKDAFSVRCVKDN